VPIKDNQKLILLYANNYNSDKTVKKSFTEIITSTHSPVDFKKLFRKLDFLLKWTKKSYHDLVEVVLLVMRHL